MVMRDEIDIFPEKATLKNLSLIRVRERWQKGESLGWKSRAVKSD